MSSPFWKKLSTGGKPQRAGGKGEPHRPKNRRKKKGTRAAARIPFFLSMARSGVRAAGGEGRPLPGDGETEQSTCQGDKAPQIYGAAPSEPFCKKGDAAAGEGAACVCAGVEQAGNERDFAVARENRRNHAGHHQRNAVHGADNDRCQHRRQSGGGRHGTGHDPRGPAGGKEQECGQPDGIGDCFFINDACQIVHKDCKQGENDAGKNGDDIAEMETLGDERGHPCGNSLPQHPLQQDAEQNDQQKS